MQNFWADTTRTFLSACETCSHLLESQSCCCSSSSCFISNGLYAMALPTSQFFEKHKQGTSIFSKNLATFYWDLTIHGQRGVQPRYNYSRVPNNRPGTIIYFQKKCTQYDLIRASTIIKTEEVNYIRYPSYQVMLHKAKYRF